MFLVHFRTSHIVMEIIFTLSPLSHFLIFLKEIISSFLYGYGQLKTNEIGWKLWVEGISIRCLAMNNNTEAGRLFLDPKCTHNLMRVTPHQSQHGLSTAAAAAQFDLFLGVLTDGCWDFFFPSSSSSLFFPY